MGPTEKLKLHSIINPITCDSALFVHTHVLHFNCFIFQCTAALGFRPKALDHLLNCSLQSVEVFSCSLLAEEETALSIIDPLTICFDLNANPLPDPKPSPSAGFLETVEDRQLLLEVKNVVYTESRGL